MTSSPWSIVDIPKRPISNHVGTAHISPSRAHTYIYLCIHMCIYPCTLLITRRITNPTHSSPETPITLLPRARPSVLYFRHPFPGKHHSCPACAHLTVIMTSLAPL